MDINISEKFSKRKIRYATAGNTSQPSIPTVVIASEAKQSSLLGLLDCFVASLLAMTAGSMGS